MNKRNEVDVGHAAGTVVKSNLTTPDFWDEFWQPNIPVQQKAGFLDKAKRTVKAILGEGLVCMFTRSYSDYVLWDHLYPQYFPPLPAAKVLEIGSAPGDYLVRLSQEFGCIPYGVEYSPTGAQINKETFAQKGLDPNNVIFADAFSDGFQSAYRGFFDVVISRGVIEHFSDVEPIVAKHSALLKPGGTLVVSVPNFRGLSYLLALIFDRGSLHAHNLEIMRESNFAQVFKGDLQPVFCGHYGVCDLAMSASGPHAKRGLLFLVGYHILDKSQAILNGFLRVLLRGKSLESSLLSPFLLCISRRTR